MRCTCCNCLLSDFEATRKSRFTQTYLDTCTKCLDGLGIETIDREDLAEEEELFDDYEEEYEDEQDSRS